MKNSVVHARIDHELKASAEAILNDLGLSASEAVRLFYRQIELNQGIPFDIRIPNQLTKETIEASERGEGIHSAIDVDDLMAQLNAED